MQNKGLILVTLTAIISGCSVFINKFGVSVANPCVFTGLKNILVALLITGAVLMARDRHIFKTLTKKQSILLVLIGLIGGSIPFLLFFKGLSLTTGIQATFIHKMLFLFVFALSAVLLKEKISRNIIIAGLALLVANIFLLNSLPHSFGMGDLLILLATIFWAGENVLSKYLLKDLPAKIIIWSRMTFGSLFIISFLAMTGQASLAFSLNTEQIAWTMITAVFLLGYVATWYGGLKYIKVSTASVILLLATPITTILSAIFLHQNLKPLQLTGLILSIIIMGVLWRYKKSAILASENS